MHEPTFSTQFPESDRIELLGAVGILVGHGYKGSAAALQRLLDQAQEKQEAAAELDALRNVYEQARGVLRHDGIDKARAIQYRDGLIEAIEEVKLIDSGTWEPKVGEVVEVVDWSRLQHLHAIDGKTPYPLDLDPLGIRNLITSEIVHAICAGVRRGPPPQDRPWLKWFYEMGTGTIKAQAEMVAPNKLSPDMWFVSVSKGFYTRMFAMHRVTVSNLRRPVLALGEEVAKAMRAIEEAEGEGNAQSKN